MKHLVYTLIALCFTAVSLAQDGTPIAPVTGNLPFQVGQAVPSVPGNLTIQPGSIGDNTPDGFAPLPGACDTAAGSYVAPGLTAARNTMISFDDIIYDNQDETLILYALYALEATELFETRNRFGTPDELNAVGPFNDGDIVTIGDQNTCINIGFLTLRLWQLNSGEWVIDTIVINESIDISDSWPDETPNLQNPGEMLAPPANPVLVTGVVFRYLLPYIEPPVTTIPSADQINSGISPCEGTPPSYLSVGMSVILSGYGYTRYPVNLDVPDYMDWEFSNTRFDLGAHGLSTFIDILNTTPLVNIVGNLDSVALTVPQLYSGGLIPTATVLGGPFCTSESVDPTIQVGNISEAPDPAPERYTTWWEIEVNGEVGYYPENVGQYSWWLWESEGIFPRNLSLYYMVPNGLAMQTAPDNCPPSRLFAGQTVQPAAGAMNLRGTPNGDIIGRVAAGQAVNVFGEPICTGGANWWSTSAGGFIAENDPTSQMPLLVQFVPPTEAVPAQPDTAATAMPTETISQNASQPTPTETVPARVTTANLQLATASPTATRPPRASN